MYFRSDGPFQGLDSFPCRLVALCGCLLVCLLVWHVYGSDVASVGVKEWSVRQCPLQYTKQDLHPVSLCTMGPFLGDHPQNQTQAVIKEGWSLVKNHFRGKFEGNLKVSVRCPSASSPPPPNKKTNKKTQITLILREGCSLISLIPLHIDGLRIQSRGEIPATFRYE